ncbi:hypothetical protein [Streptomyces sp. RFCAC02]|uniref:hypothetical protein n=1 Tax=Streptomyces sp. RFCAC02 TaxID=2499143 RepID=UPI001020F59A|nr:hypothetical protein [Streptomyces sp. RFCAC02]
MADTEEQVPAPGDPAAAGPSGREVERLARRVRAFTGAHGGADGAEAQIAYLGTRGHRLVIVGADGAWGDVVAADRDALEGAAVRAGVALRPALDGETAGRLRTGPYEWSRMAGLQLGGGRPGGADA